GSDLGPALVTEALTPYHDTGCRFHFVANVDGNHISDVLQQCRPQSTLFIVSSKSFKTQETVYNAQTAKQWLIDALGEDVVQQHFVAVTANKKAATDFGITEHSIFPIWDWVGGRFSVWSAIGLPVMMAVGVDNFYAFLQGAHEMDQHFKSAPLEKNMPVILALLSVWYINFFHSLSRAVIPYDCHLSRLPAYLQQAHMESNGKCIRVDGQATEYHTSPVIFGTTGSNGQHAFHQLLHQGTHMVPVDFILALKTYHSLRQHQRHLVANCFSQSQALMMGNQETGHKAIAGNKPSNTIIMEQLTPYNMGALLALYEHKIFSQGIIWGINSFDQWGVELGKVMAEVIFNDLQPGLTSSQYDSSTTGLIQLFAESQQ
ncbi:MAG: glucose-6-phosphate isomerase, partial [Coxiellaceae bacterium]|nr:glucose-6-phosphate isomerase [Coxiellaceae bacterium]